MLRKASQADTAGSFGRMGKFAVVAVTEVKQGPPAILLTQKHAFKRWKKTQPHARAYSSKLFCNHWTSN